jgi:hypothetical protein
MGFFQELLGGKKEEVTPKKKVGKGRFSFKGN